MRTHFYVCWSLIGFFLIIFFLYLEDNNLLLVHLRIAFTQVTHMWTSYIYIFNWPWNIYCFRCLSNPLVWVKLLTWSMVSSKVSTPFPLHTHIKFVYHPLKCTLGKKSPHFSSFFEIEVPIPWFTDIISYYIMKLRLKIF